MGIFDKLFGKKEEYPPLDPASEALKSMDAVQEPLQSLAGSVKDRLEVIPLDGAAYIYIGKPPEYFGLAWVEDGKLGNLKSLLGEKGASPEAVKALTERLREIYVKAEAEKRYSYKVGGRDVVVTPARQMAEGIKSALNTVN